MTHRTWADGLNPDVLEDIVVEALSDGDIRGVSAAMRILAVRDPHRADQLLATMELGLLLRNAVAG